MDGGDAIYIGSELFVGITGRTNEHAVRSLEHLLGDRDVVVVPVPVTNVLHLKSVCTPIASDLFLVSEQFAAAEAIAGRERLIVPETERYAANCLSVNGTVVVSEGYPQTRAVIESRGLRTLALDMSEFRKCGGSLTCLSILL
jgi:dimethylargininase